VGIHDFGLQIADLLIFCFKIFYDKVSCHPGANGVHKEMKTRIPAFKERTSFRSMLGHQNL